MSKVILITGCSSGIGLATAVLLSKENKVYASMRDLSRQDRLLAAKQDKHAEFEVLQLDVTSDESVKKAVNTIIEKEGRIDVLVNNAGYGLVGPAETVSIEQAKAEFEVNFFGLLRVTQAVLPNMRANCQGHIVNISSIAGIKAMPTSDLYNASKFAVEGLSEAMAPTLSLAGIKVSLIEPGPVSTDFNSRSMDHGRQFNDVEIYKKATDRMAKVGKEKFENAQEPHEVAKVINEAITSEKPMLRYQTSEWVKQMAKDKLRDLSGNELIDNYVKVLSG